ncbi:hypothetical protein H0X06_06965, partial [Candidatus Dependentiae bacterium]|nr:hypothetical protein [Candidatus Dependentiae bacterium]
IALSSVNSIQEDASYSYGFAVGNRWRMLFITLIPRAMAGPFIYGQLLLAFLQPLEALVTVHAYRQAVTSEK